ncbi:MAG: BMP family ABC transporter substrate-binding protein [Chloroflexi bacterium]|nr:MAG: BMP family ABC transporter substrate-binding protein [Chloroflexota bacterium]
MLKKTLIISALVMLLVGMLPLAAFAQDGEMEPIESVCLVTDLGRVNDGTFNQFAHLGAQAAAEDFDLDYSFIETQSETDYAANIQTCVNEGFDAIVTVGFLIADATREAAEANPDVYFIGVDQFVPPESPKNLVGIQFREDQAGFLAGALAAMVSESGIVAGIYGIDIPPVVKFRNGFEQGAHYVNPDIETLGVYIDDFVAPDRGASAAEQFIGEGADVIFGAGGPTGTGGILAAAAQGVWVIGVDQDEYVTSFGEGETEGAEFVISSAMKRVDQGVYDMIAALAEGRFEDFPGGGMYVMGAAENGIGLAPKHDADVPDEVYEALDEIFEGLASGEIDTGVDPVTGELKSDMEDMGGEDMGAEMTPEATEEAESSDG